MTFKRFMPFLFRNCFSSSLRHFVWCLFVCLRSIMMFCDCLRALWMVFSISWLPSPRGAFISHFSPSILISGVCTPSILLAGISSTSKPCSVRKTAVAFSWVFKTTPLGVILPFSSLSLLYLLVGVNQINKIKEIYPNYYINLYNFVRTIKFIIGEK